MGQSKETIKAALVVDDTLLSRMLSVAETIPAVVIDAIGAARTVGPRQMGGSQKADETAAPGRGGDRDRHSDAFRAQDAAGRFACLLGCAESVRKDRASAPRGRSRRRHGRPQTRAWSRATGTMARVSPSRSTARTRARSVDTSRPIWRRFTRPSGSRETKQNQEIEPQKKKAPERRRPEAFSDLSTPRIPLPRIAVRGRRRFGERISFA